MGIRMVIELPDQGSVQTVMQALEAYKVRLRAGIARKQRRWPPLARYGVDTAHFSTR
jgi:hypothetical protein